MVRRLPRRRSDWRIPRAGALIPDLSPRSATWPPASRPPHRPRRQQGLKRRGLVTLTGREYYHHRFALALGVQVHRRGPTPLTVAERFRLGPDLGQLVGGLFFAPAAC